ncbi:hypothetical protein RSAG8_09327, partial [Rhizoctonia solani AG-8 WAC10335]
MYLFPAYLLESLGLDRPSTALSTATTAPMLASTAYLLESLGLDRLSTALSTATTAPMLASTDTLQQVPLVGFLDAYPEPAFILSSNAGPRSSLALFPTRILFGFLTRHRATHRVHHVLLETRI